MTEEKEITINKTELPIQERIVKNDTEFKIVDLEQVIKRLEQENRANEKQIELDVEHICRLNEQIEKLEQENKKLKKDVQLFKCLDTFGESECHCACRCLGNEFCEDADKKINNYRSALEEINRVVKLAHKVEDYLLGQDYTDLVDRIQNKINEVLDE